MRNYWNSRCPNYLNQKEGHLLDVVAMKLLDRFERTDSIDDLNRAITMEEQAVKSIPDGHLDRAGRLNNLGSALQRRFEWTGSMDDLERAIVKVTGSNIDDGSDSLRLGLRHGHRTVPIQADINPTFWVYLSQITSLTKVLLSLILQLLRYSH
jgi:hypothetical protein